MLDASENQKFTTVHHLEMELDSMRGLLQKEQEECESFEEALMEMKKSQQASEAEISEKTARIAELEAMLSSNT